MHAQLEQLERELESATTRLTRLRDRFAPEAWRALPAPDAWSAADCVVHLNLTSAAYLPLLDEALERTRRTTGGAPARFRRDPIGWLIWMSVRPSTRMKARTIPEFVPSEAPARDRILEEFERLQSEIVSRLHHADGLPIQKVKMASPFSEHARYSLYSVFTILPAHQHRHVDQAERALEASRG